MTDLLKILREPSNGWSGDAFAIDPKSAEEAADEIERLTAERDEARRREREWHNASAQDRAENARMRAWLEGILGGYAHDPETTLDDVIGRISSLLNQQQTNKE
jgi:hypothetical protein